jgi:hypothetical protein
MDAERLEERGGHLRKEGFQESIDTPESKLAELRKHDMRHGWRMGQLPLNVCVGARRDKAYLEYLQMRQV